MTACCPACGGTTGCYARSGRCADCGAIFAVRFGADEAGLLPIPGDTQLRASVIGVGVLYLLGARGWWVLLGAPLAVATVLAVNLLQPKTF